MGYYCTVPQCTSLAGKTKNVKFHRFPRDETMADKWNVILKRGKPYTKYSKVCSLHFTQDDYNVTAMGKNKGQWKTLNKEAVPSKNLPKLNPDGSVMVIRKSRTVKYKEAKKDDFVRLYTQSNKDHAASVNHSLSLTHSNAVISHRTDHIDHTDHTDHIDTRIPSYHHQTVLAQNQSVPHHNNCGQKPKKQDAIMQTDPMSEEDEPQVNQSYSEASETSYNSENTVEGYAGYNKKEPEYSKKEDYLPQTNEEYNKEAEKYALERKSHNSNYEKPIDPLSIGDIYYDKQAYPRADYAYANGYQDSVEQLRNQQHNLQILQDQHRVTENQNFFHENAIKQEVDLKDDEKYIYERSKEQIEQNNIYQEQSILEQRLMEHSPVKQEPEVANGHESTMQPQPSPFYTANGHTVPDYYTMPRPGPELLIAKQNALANMQLWQNAKRPYDISNFNGSQLFHKEDMQRILQ